ncbi:phenylalanine--tRNA ligase subunit beta [Camelliibacillus cellulosilyticus]|uniref:Phenylalanine--tRNA ligase beta subunit n=1 Tax=Camelliibacillus cellulosilyticus TaxID=2174486 RepID=A0ABV9GNG5_9BACL
MRVSYNWLNDYVDLSGVTPEALAEKITKAGIEVEHIHYLGEGIKDVVVGFVKTCGPHPNADKLKLCQVDLGEETVQIVCGAPNVAAGQKVAVAKVGAVLPGNFKIKKAKLRGEVSEGMICSMQELGVEAHLVPKEVANGIYILDEDAAVGANALPYLNLDDAVLELDILPNSAHCLNMIGVAYEVAAILDRDVRLPEPNVEESARLAAEKVSVTVVDQDVVPFYGARVIENVTIGPSPRWMQNRLIAAGIRPISNVVDITNYVLLEYGQPLHAFDYDRFGSEEVVVRRASEGETMTTLDDVHRTLTAEDFFITNGRFPVAIAGVMGGANSEVSDETKTVLLEAAVFDGRAVRRTSARLGLRTDASQRYEKGIDRNRVLPAADRAAAFMTCYAGGQVLKGVVYDGEKEVAARTIEMPWRKINSVLGTDLNEDDILSVLRRLRFEAKIAGDILTVTVPSRRPDVTIPEDLCEEVGRIYGYDYIPATLPEGAGVLGGLTNAQKKRREIEQYMTGAGWFQAVTYSLTTVEKTATIAYVEQANHRPIALSMPMTEERAVLRLSLLPELLEAVKYHVNRQMPDIALFEIGKVFLSHQETLTELPEEKERLTGAITGKKPEDWHHDAPTVDFYTVKGVVEGLFDLFGLSEAVRYHASRRKGMHPGRTADILLNDKAIGFLGQVHPERQKQLDLKDTYVFEIDLSVLLTADLAPISYETLPRFPAITRDIALVVDEGVPAQALFDVIKKTGAPLLKDVKLFDVYKGEHLESGKKSLAFSLTYLDPERTLTDKEVAKVHEQVLAQLEHECGAVLRS